MNTLTTKQAADRLTQRLGRPVSAQNVLTWITTGRLPAERPGRDYLLQPSDVDAFVRPARGNANRQAPHGCISQAEYARRMSTPERTVARSLVQDWMRRGKVEFVTDASGHRWIKIVDVI